MKREVRKTAFVNRKDQRRRRISRFFVANLWARILRSLSPLIVAFVRPYFAKDRVRYANRSQGYSDSVSFRTLSPCTRSTTACGTKQRLRKPYRLINQGNLPAQYWKFQCALHSRGAFSTPRLRRDTISGISWEEQTRAFPHSLSLSAISETYSRICVHVHSPFVYMCCTGYFK